MEKTKKKKILIVDDEPFLVRALREKLETEGFLVDSAADGQAGLDVVFSLAPDLILLDLVMPKMDGMAMLRKLRQDERGKKIPVIVLSNLNNAKSIDASLAAGAQKFLVKVNNSLDDIVCAVKSQLK